MFLVRGSVVSGFAVLCWAHCQTFKTSKSVPVEGSEPDTWNISLFISRQHIDGALTGEGVTEHACMFMTHKVRHLD